jgi:hypothetical protein
VTRTTEIPMKYCQDDIGVGRQRASKFILAKSRDCEFAARREWIPTPAFSDMVYVFASRFGAGKIAPGVAAPTNRHGSRLLAAVPDAPAISRRKSLPAT